MKNIIIGIYKVTSPSGKVYIGQSKNIYYRFQKYQYLICKSQIKLYRSLKKHGADKHTYEVLEECNIDKLNERELYYQKFYNSVSSGLNCIYVKGLNLSISEETKQKMSASQTERFRNLLERQKMSLAAKKRNASYTEEEKKRLKNVNKGRKISAHIIEKLKLINSKEKHPQAKKVINIITNKIYPCAILGWEKEIKDYYTYGYFCQMLSNKRKNKTNFSYYE